MDTFVYLTLDKWETASGWFGWAAAVILASIAPGLHGPSWALTIDETAPSCAWIGAEVSSMTAPVANSLGMAVPYGAIFDRPKAGSPAANAGLKRAT